jgi:hypothetical protein
MAASDYVPIFFKNRLHLEGRPQMSTRPRLLAPCRRSRARRYTAANIGDRLPALHRDRRELSGVTGQDLAKILRSSRAIR